MQIKTWIQLCDRASIYKDGLMKRENKLVSLEFDLYDQFDIICGLAPSNVALTVRPRLYFSSCFCCTCCPSAFIVRDVAMSLQNSRNEPHFGEDPDSAAYVSCADVFLCWVIGWSVDLTPSMIRCAVPSYASAVTYSGTGTSGSTLARWRPSASARPCGCT